MNCNMCGSPAEFMAVEFAPYGYGPKGKVFYYRCTKCGEETRHIYGNNYYPTVTGNIYSEEAARAAAKEKTEFFYKKGNRP